MAVRISIFWNV